VIKKILKLLIIIAVILIVIIVTAFIYAILQKPSLDKNWQEDSKILPNITILENNEFVTIKNIRDWRYAPDEILSTNYYEETFDINKLSKTHLLFNPFGRWDGIGHSFFVFEFEDGKEVSISIEARREEGEPYKVELGLLNQYEIWYAIGSSADFLARRAIYHQEDLYLYPLLITATSSKALFLDMISIAKRLETKPDFYNTLTSNCTNLLAESANRVKEGVIPWHYSRIFTGFADNQLYDLKLIPHDKPFKEIYENAKIDEKITEMYNAKMSKEDFWIRIQSF
jgi:hypothetical protein